jgi:hypothetical protein
MSEQIYNITIIDYETDFETKIKSPVIPKFRQTITYYNLGELHQKKVRFVEYIYDIEGNFSHICLNVVDELDDDDIVE